jgi:TatD DNase family protein
MGTFFSFSGDTSDERKTRKREALRAVPRDRILVETDAPDLPPPPAFRPYLSQDTVGKELNRRA